VEIDKEGKEARVIRSLIKLDGKKILEIGCGAGRLTKILKATNNFVLAIDSDEKKVRAAQEVVPTAKFLVATIHDINPQSTDLFDIIVFSMSLHHIGYAVEEKLRALTKAKSLLKPGGQILVIEPTRQSAVTAIVKEFYPEETILILFARQALQEFVIARKRVSVESLVWRYEQRTELIRHFSQITNTKQSFSWWRKIFQENKIPKKDIELVDVVAFYLLQS